MLLCVAFWPVEGNKKDWWKEQRSSYSASGSFVNFLWYPISRQKRAFFLPPFLCPGGRGSSRWINTLWYGPKKRRVSAHGGKKKFSVRIRENDMSEKKGETLQAAAAQEECIKIIWSFGCKKEFSPLMLGLEKSEGDARFFCLHAIVLRGLFDLGRKMNLERKCNEFLGNSNTKQANNSLLKKVQNLIFFQEKY